MENRARNILVQVMLYTARILMACSSMCVFIYIYIYIYNARSYNIKSNVTHSHFSLLYILRRF